MTRSKLLARKDQLTAELQATNAALPITKHTKPAQRERLRLLKPDLMEQRERLAAELVEVNLQLQQLRRVPPIREFEPASSRADRPSRPALSIEPLPTVTYARPEGPRVPQHLYTKTLRKHRDRYPVR